MPTDSIEPNALVRLLGKPAREFTPADLIRAVEELELQQVNLRYVGGDGRLKTLAFPVTSTTQLTETLVRGERVDASSVFPGTETEQSDVYIVPRWRTAFLNPFGEHRSLDLLCSFYDAEGRPLPFAREQVLRRAAESLREATGTELEAMGELEYYLVEAPDERYPVQDEAGYQESAPFSKRQDVREQVLGHLQEMGVALKYAHGEVGNIREPDRQLVQGEIELAPAPLEEAADAVVLAKWVLREVAEAHGVEATFAPSVSADGAGTGLHVHCRLVRDGANAIAGPDGINDTGRRLVAGLLSLAKPMSAFGNRVPTSFLRFADGDESPEGIGWGDRDRTGLVRVPLAWAGDVLGGMVRHANPGQPVQLPEPELDPQTVELRLGDGSADIHLLMAAMAVAARRGLTDPDSLARAERLEANNPRKLDQLPTSCAEAADALAKNRAAFEEDDVFPPELIDVVLQELRGHDDAKLHKRIAKNDEARAELIRRYWHVG